MLRVPRGGDKSRFIQLLEKVEGQYSLSCRFNLVEGDFTWIVTRVYDPTKVERREFFFFWRSWVP